MQTDDESWVKLSATQCTNETAFALRNEDVSLLKRRNKLFDKAKLKIDHEGFQYK